MKKIICIILFTLSVAPLYASAQDDLDKVVSFIQDAIEEGNAATLADRSSAYVEISILGTSTLYSRSQAGYILKEFFRENPSGPFAFQRRINVGNDWYMHGTYWNEARQETYRVELRLRMNNGTYEIKNIRITYVDR